jgi:Tfp pilus assembly protein PilF
VVRGLALRAEGGTAEALEVLGKAAAREDATEKHVVTPGPILPAREILAHARLEAGDARAALADFKSVLEREPNRYRALAGAAKAAELAGSSSRTLR